MCKIDETGVVYVGGVHMLLVRPLCEFMKRPRGRLWNSYQRILEARLRKYVEPKLGEWHNGFLPGRGTTDMIFSLKMIFEKS